MAVTQCGSIHQKLTEIDGIVSAPAGADLEQSARCHIKKALNKSEFP